MRDAAIARRFAKAFIAAALEAKSVEQYGQELAAASSTFKVSPELYKFLLNPMYKLTERTALLDKVSGALGLSSPVQRLLTILVENRAIRLLEQVSSAYSRLADEISGRLRATVKSPFDLSADALEEIKDRLKAATGREAVLSFEKDENLLGGLVVRIDNTIIDGSLKRQLEFMKEKILEGVV